MFTSQGSSGPPLGGLGGPGGLSGLGGPRGPGGPPPGVFGGPNDCDPRNQPPMGGSSGGSSS